MKKRLLIVIFLWSAISLFPLKVYALGLAKISVVVTDEEKKPIDGAEIELCLYGGCETKDAIRGKTDIHGVYTVSGSSSDGQVGGGVRKEGYYSSIVHQDFMVKKLGMWQPWDKKIFIVLRPKINPVPMYVRDRSIDVPIIGRVIGFDLMKFDWVIPYGQGVHPDFLFKVDLSYQDIDNFDSTLTLSFSNEFDGIQLVKDDLGGDFNIGSKFRLPRIAPMNGYQRKLVKHRSVKSGVMHNDRSENSNYIYRVRSEIKNRKLLRAIYGKVKGDISIEITPESKTKARISMCYYLNPDYTNNLEFDVNRNLFSHLPTGERYTKLP